MTPLDLERVFGLIGGESSTEPFAQPAFQRAAHGGQAAIAARLPGLYLCGAGSHPAVA